MRPCKYKCRLDASFCYYKQCWNKDNCRCKCKESIDKGICDKEIDCKCDKLCDTGE